jgi:hypothetical protein
MPNYHLVLRSLLVCSPQSRQINQENRLKSLYQEAPLYYLSSFSCKQKVDNQLAILYQNLNKILTGNPIYGCLTQEAIDNLIQLYPFLATSTELVEKFSGLKLMLEDLYVLLTHAQIDLKTTVDPIKTALRENEAFREVNISFSDRVMQQTKLLEVLIKKLILQLASYQRSSHLFKLDTDLYYGETIYYKDIVRSVRFKQTTIRTKVNLDSSKFREIKWQFLALVNHLEYLLEQKLLYKLEDSNWFVFRRFFVRERYSPDLLPCLFSSVKVNLERLVCFLELSNSDVDKIQLVIKKIIENDYTFYSRDWLPSHRLTSEEAKAEYISQYIRKIDETIRLSVDSLFARGFYLEKEITSPEATIAFTSKLASKRCIEKRSRGKRKQHRPKKLNVRLTSRFFSAPSDIVNKEKKTVTAIPVITSNFNSSMPLTDEWRQAALQTNEFEALYQVICNTIISLGEYSIRIKRPTGARGAQEQEKIDSLRHYLVPLIVRLFKIKTRLNDHSNKRENLAAVCFELKVMDAFQELENKVEAIQKKDRDFVLETSSPSLSKVSL